MPSSYTNTLDYVGNLVASLLENTEVQPWFPPPQLDSFLKLLFHRGVFLLFPLSLPLSQ